MRKAGAQTQKGNTDLLVGDLVKYLSRLAGMQADARTGNPQMSDGLSRLAEVLKPFKSRTIDELPELLHASTGSKHHKSGTKPPIELPPDLASMAGEEVERILSDERYLKKQIVELGASRFGISRAKLSRLPGTEVINSIRAALEHERSLTAIADHARRVGERRFS